MRNYLAASMVFIGNIASAFGTDTLDNYIVDRYLTRIGLTEDVLDEPRNEALLNKLVQHHLVAIPFENLDMHTTPKRPILIAHDVIIGKVLLNSHGTNRGGYCYEINELFYCLLKTLGFDVSRHKASVWVDKKPGTVATPSHQFSMVNIGDQRFMVDVGFGLYSLFRAIRLPTGSKIENREGAVVIKRVTFDDGFDLQEQGREGYLYERWSESKHCWERIASFALTAYGAEDYRGHNEFVQNSDLPFIENIIFTRFTSDGRMIRCVSKRDEFSSADEIVSWINKANVGCELDLGVN